MSSKSSRLLNYVKAVAEIFEWPRAAVQEFKEIEVPVITISV
jgi:hypothetical protein